MGAENLTKGMSNMDTHVCGAAHAFQLEGQRNITAAADANQVLSGATIQASTVPALDTVIGKNPHGLRPNVQFNTILVATNGSVAMSCMKLLAFPRLHAHLFCIW